MAEFRANVTGLQGVNAAFQRLRGALQRRVALEAVRAGGRVATQSIRKFAPRDDGFLRRSVRARRLKPRGDEVAIVRADWGRAFYGRFQDLGWFSGGKRRASRAKAYGAVPFFKGRFGAGNRLTVRDKVRVGIRDRRRRLAEPRFIPGFNYIERAARDSEPRVNAAVEAALRQALARAWGQA